MTNLAIQRGCLIGTCVAQITVNAKMSPIQWKKCLVMPPKRLLWIPIIRSVAAFTVRTPEVLMGILMAVDTIHPFTCEAVELVNTFSAVALGTG